jgi:aminoglycoside 3-N-acetyltransferase
MNTLLFKSQSCQFSTKKHLSDALRKCGAHDCDILFIHAGMSFGLPVLSRKELLHELWSTLNELSVPTVCVPVFTFSFPNEEIFDVQKSPSRMGSLTEYIRNLPSATRSKDPLMSVALVGANKDLVTDIGNESCGANRTFNRLSMREGVKFAFLGVRAGDCFTYMHHLEWQAKVPYRYDRQFSGIIRDNNMERKVTFTLNVRYNNVHTSDGSYKFEEYLLNNGIMKQERFGDGTVSCVSEKDARPVYLNILKNNPNFFITNPFDPTVADYTFKVQGKMVSM